MQNLYQALSKVKKEMVAIKKTSDNPYFKSKYANLEAHLDMIEPLLEKHGLLLLQPPIAQDGTTAVRTLVVHVDSGESLESSILIPQNLTDAQKIGASVTYFRRFLINATFAMKSEDQDGNDITDKQTKPASYAPDKKSSFRKPASTGNSEEW
jgi:hypothetical protein